MDWSDQMQDMMKTWMNTQRRMWDGFFDTMQGAGQSQFSRVWEQTLDVGEKAMQNTYKAQADWMQAWLEGLESVEGMPESGVEYAKQFQEMAQRWGESQQKLLANWFEMLRNLDPNRKPDSWESTVDKMFKAWQDTTQKIMDTQMEWMRSWAGAAKKEETE